MIQNLLNNWKTTSAGLTMIIGSVVHLFFSVKAHTGDETTWTVSLTAIVAGLGLIFAGDASATPPSTPPAAGTGTSPVTKVGIMLFCIGLACSVGCMTQPTQTTAFNTLATVEQSTSAAYDAYIQLVIANQLPTNDVPSVSAKFNNFQSAMTLAIVLVNNNTNVLAPANLVTEGQDILNVISTIKAGK